MTVDRQLISTLHTAFNGIFQQSLYADKVIQHHLHDNPHWRREDKAYFVTTLYDLVRFIRKLAYASNASEQDFWPVWQAFQLLNDKPIPDWPEMRNLSKAELLTRLDTASQAIQLSYPDWLDTLGSSQLGQQWPQVAEALNRAPGYYVRANTLKTSADALAGKLEREQISCEHISSALPDALVIQAVDKLFKSSAFQSGECEMQDAGSQQIAPLLDVAPGMKVVDACAGAGGKSLHLAALMKNKGRLLSMDIHQHKLDTLKKRAKRAGCHMIETRAIKNNKTIKRLKDKFDRVLLDVPCSGTGVLRRNPDSKWHLSEQSISDLIALQADLLQRYSQMCRPGGKLVYATCSILPVENQQQVVQFLDANPDWTLQQELSLLPGINSEFDGFYGAVLCRNELPQD
ncbi:RsmB/NOP family class I SAM-dependent RNA methyltransferase [Pseudoalteromonas ardens]|uniref:RNA methyltransferase n=1 Tax=Pseudoalteromonas rubra TaxID=43658 RepID=A0A0L0EQ83_9GAMM|nr:RsmB/NOP family class I SAM-dependent RNA methyltransferase [Pseudoalteromonas sp. R96]KNC66642.1 RNA methyltransferase [Pseudoalteromonas rubra]MDK1310465.1 RsmB/NOP family class I SAM-dependent RNA methyltransferase [Pseudoalteromonas sp. R96]